MVCRTTVVPRSATSSEKVPVTVAKACGGAIVIIMQRLHEDDLVGHVLAQRDWEKISGIAETDEVHQIETIWGTGIVQPPPG